MRIFELSIREQGIGERVIGECANLGASDWGVIEINNTLKNDQEYVLFDTPSACNETM